MRVRVVVARRIFARVIVSRATALRVARAVPSVRDGEMR